MTVKTGPLAAVPHAVVGMILRITRKDDPWIFISSLVDTDRCRIREPKYQNKDRKKLDISHGRGVRDESLASDRIWRLLNWSSRGECLYGIWFVIWCEVLPDWLALMQSQTRSGIHDHCFETDKGH